MFLLLVLGISEAVLLSDTVVVALFSGIVTVVSDDTGGVVQVDDSQKGNGIFVCVRERRESREGRLEFYRGFGDRRRCCHVERRGE